MFIDNLTPNERKYLVGKIIKTYNAFHKNKVPSHAIIKENEDGISINWEINKSNHIRRMKICITDIDVYFIGLEGCEEVENVVFDYLDRKFPDYSDWYNDEIEK